MCAEEQEVYFGGDIEILSLDKWLDYASGCDKSVFVALPLIQRGSVWKPKQIIDLWDTLLRGMPMGSLMYSPMKPGIDVREICGKDMIKTPESETIGLIDGQQRTLAMLIAWPKIGEKMDRRIWVDFADTPGDEHLFRLHVTTKNQPFGFQKSSPSTKLSLGERGDAHDKFIEHHGKNDLSHDFMFKMAIPYHAKLPLDLRVLIECWNHLGNKAAWIKKTEGMLAEKIDDLGQAKARIHGFANALERLFKLQIPLLKVDRELFSVVEDDNETIDPPLAVLFKRIGTGGTPLSDADYVYSVIKHRLPQSYKLVTELHGADTLPVYFRLPTW